MVTRLLRRVSSPGCCAAVALCLLAWPGIALAQVNTETFRIGEPEPGLQGALQGRLSLIKGNVNLVQLGLNATGFYHAGIHTPLVAVRADYAEQDGNKFLQRGFTHSRWTAMWWPRIGTEVFGQLQYDAFLRLKFRALAGAGLRAVAVQGESLEFVVSAGYMLEREVLNIAQSNRHPRTTLFHRLTTYGTLKAAIDDNLTLTNVLYLQPRFADVADLRLLDDLELSVKVTEVLSFTNTLNYRLDTKPPDGVAKYDVTLSLGLRISS